MAITLLFTHEFMISRPERQSDGQGGWRLGYVDVGLVRGRLRPARARDETVALQPLAKISHMWYGPADTDVRRGDLISGAGQVVEATAVREPSHAGHHLEVDCREWQKEAEIEAGS